MTQQATSAREIFEAMTSRFMPEQAGEIQATIQFDLSGEGGGQWHLEVADGKAVVHDGAATNPAMTMGMAAADYVALINGALNPTQAFMQGKIRIKGDMALALKMQTWFKRD